MKTLRNWLRTHWPKGRYNGHRIGGFSIKAEINMAWWSWPFLYWKNHSRCLHIGPLHVWFDVAYEH
jgi:hypothetical protein